MIAVITFSAFDLFVEVEEQLLCMNYVRYSADDFIHLCVMTYEDDTIRELEDIDVEILIDALFLNAEQCRDQYTGEVPLYEDIFIMSLLLCKVRDRLNYEMRMLNDINQLQFHQIVVRKAQVTIIYEA